MKTLNIAEARQNFSALVDEVRLGGEPVVISKYGRPAVMITTFSVPGGGAKPQPPRDWRAERGLRDDTFVLPPDFDDPMDDIWSVFTDEQEDLAK